MLSRNCGGLFLPPSSSPLPSFFASFDAYLWFVFLPMLQASVCEALHPKWHDSLEILFFSLPGSTTTLNSERPKVYLSPWVLAMERHCPNGCGIICPLQTLWQNGKSTSASWCWDCSVLTWTCGLLSSHQKGFRWDTHKQSAHKRAYSSFKTITNIWTGGRGGRAAVGSLISTKGTSSHHKQRENLYQKHLIVPTLSSWLAWCYTQYTRMDFVFTFLRWWWPQYTWWPQYSCSLSWLNYKGFHFRTPLQVISDLCIKKVVSQSAPWHFFVFRSVL